MGMQQKFREYIKQEREIVLPTGRGPRGAFSDLFPSRHYGAHYGDGTYLGNVYMEYSEELDQETEAFDRDGLLEDAITDGSVRAEIIEGVLHKVARRRGKTIFRLLSGTSPELEAAFNFYCDDLRGDYLDYLWAATSGGVRPEDLFEVDQMRTTSGMSGILRASQGRASKENGVRLPHVARVLAVRASAPGWSYHIKELAEGVSRGVFDDALLRGLAASPFETRQFKVAVDALLEGIPADYAFEVAEAA